jgi:hypothetical protein
MTISAGILVRSSAYTFVTAKQRNSIARSKFVEFFEFIGFIELRREKIRWLRQGSLFVCLFVCLFVWQA